MHDADPGFVASTTHLLARTLVSGLAVAADQGALIARFLVAALGRGAILLLLRGVRRGLSVSAEAAVSSFDDTR